MKKLLSLIIAAVMIFSALTPALKASKEEARQILDEIRSMENLTPEDKEIQEKFIEKGEELIDGAYGFNPETIYDLDSIPARIKLLGVLGRALRFATTELANKIDSAHSKIAGYIFGGLVKVANPFASVRDIEEYGEKFEALAAELRNYPELGPDDTANLYKRAAFDELLTEARFLRFNELKDKDTETIRELDRAILKFTGLRLKPQTTVGELDAAAIELKALIERAKQGEERATKKACRELRSVVWKLRGMIIRGEISDQLIEQARELSRETAKLMMQIRPNAAKVEELRAAIQNIIDDPKGEIVVVPAE